MITSKQELFNTLIKWIEESIPSERLSAGYSGPRGRKWFLQALSFDLPLKLENLRTITDRSELNKEFVKRQEEKKQPNKKGVSAIKMEISALYSFNKCVVQRYKGRMHFYRDDLSQKGKRNMVCMGRALGVFQELKNNLD